MLTTYLEQLTSLAAARKVDLRKAVLHAGIADSQWYRWQAGRTRMSEQAATKISTAIEDLADALPRSIRTSH